MIQRLFIGYYFIGKVLKKAYEHDTLALCYLCG